MTAGLAALVARGEVPWPLPGLVALAFVQYVIDSRADRGARLRASVLGRWNGIAYFAPVAAGRDAPGPHRARHLLAAGPGLAPRRHHPRLHARPPPHPANAQSSDPHEPGG